MGLFRKRKDKENIIDLPQIKSIDLNEGNILANISNDELISIEVLSSEFSIEKYRKNEIVDPAIISQLSHIVQNGYPQLMQTLGQKSLQKAVKDAGELITSNIPLNQLAGAKDLPGRYRGFMIGKNGIESHTELSKFDTKSITSSGKVVSRVSKVMNVSSFIVGQYYMNEVNTKLISINQSISSISDFQQRELKSKIISLAISVQEISNFGLEILKNQQLCSRELLNLDKYKKESIQLLEQVNITITEMSMKNEIHVNHYINKVYEFENLLKYQKFLVDILEEISKLTYLLNQFEVSKEKCFSVYEKMIIGSNKARECIPTWQARNQEKFNIEIEHNRYKKQGLESYFYKALALIDKKWEYVNMDKDMAELMRNQMNQESIKTKSFETMMKQEVEFICVDGKYYFVPSKDS